MMKLPLKSILFEVIERALVAGVLSLLKVRGSLPTYLVTKLVEHGFDKVVVPIINQLVNSGRLYYDKKKGAMIVKKLHKAKNEKDKDTYNDIVLDIFK